MVEENPSEFRFSIDDQDPETFYHEELKDLRVEQLSQRIMLLSILLPILIGVAIFFAYRDLTGRVSRSQDTGVVEVQRISSELEELSKNFNEKLITFSTTLSSQDKDFGTTVSGKLAAVNKNVAALNKSVAALNKNFKSLDQNLHKTRSTLNKLAASKADKKSQQAAVAKINDGLKPLKKELKSLAKLRRDVKGVSSDIKKLEGALNRKLAKMSAAAAEQSQKNFGQLQTSIAALADDKIDRDTFDLEVFKIKKNYRNSLAQEIAAVNQKMETIQKRLDDTQENSKSPKKSMKSLSKTAPSAKSTGTTITGTTKATTPAKSGSIEEQDLAE
jgi:septal ring factor EnvC (AmiA/AmiB activator)